MTHYYCSTFSKNYAYKGLLLYDSLQHRDKDFHFFMICLHDQVIELYKKMNLKKVTLIPLSAVEGEDRRLRAVKETRKEREYAWTSKASVMIYIFNHYRDVDHIVWLDGDTYFFSDPGPIFEEWSGHSILLTSERWVKADKQKIKRYGKYNTGFMGFKRDKHAIDCLNWFRNSLIKWCYARHEHNLWSDQVYVNDWPKRFTNVGVIKNIGINVTPYIIAENRLTKNGDELYINGRRLVFFHYSKFNYFNGHEFELCSYVDHFPDDALKWVYRPYIEACNKIMAQIDRVYPDFYRKTNPRDQYINNYFNLEANEKANQDIPKICTLLTKKYLVQGLALYYSLKKHSPRFNLWILCVDDTAYNLLAKMNLSNVTLISLKNIRNRILAKIKRKRQTSEFCWTLKATLLNYLIKNNFNFDSVLYMDADLFFFKDVRNIYSQWGEHSVFITKLRLNPKWEQRRGRYSAGLVGFKRDQAGMACLQSWRINCLKWCYDRQKGGLWGDQKYMNDWPRLYSGIKISEHKGINVGPWNITKGRPVHAEGEDIYFENTEVVCYHFSGFEIINENEFELCKYKKVAAEAEQIYSPYLEEIRKIIARVKSLDSSFFHRSVE